jgi:NTE family protein
MAKNGRLLFSLCLLLTFSPSAHPQDRPKVGLVLSGAGAKGVAHLPILKLLDELDFPVDYIAGTSAGGIMGGLYAAGYSGAEIERIISALDWVDLFSDRPPRGLTPYFEKRLDGRYQLEFPLRKGLPSTPRGLIAGQKFYNLFSSLFFPLTGDLDFNDLPIPFRCVAVDIITGKQVILDRGSLARALRATMAIPTIFAPVEWEEYLLVDGGLLNNLPVDVVKDMGAEIVIAVDLANPLSTREELATAEKILGQSLQVVEVEQKKGKMDKVDLLIWPDMKGLSSTDYFSPDRMARIRERGEEAARKAQPALEALKEKHGLSRALGKDTEIPLGRDQKRTLGQVVFTGNTKIPSSFIAKLFGLKPDDIVDAALITRQLNELYSLRYFEDIQYDVFPGEAKRIDLRLSVRELPRGNFRVGLRYDNYHKLVAAAGLYATNFPFPGLRLDNDLEVAGLTRILSKVSFPTETLNFPVYPLIHARYEDVPTRLYWGDGRVITTYKDRSFSLGGGLGFLLKKSLNLELSYELERMNIKSQPEFALVETSPTLEHNLRKIEVAATFDTLDDRRVPKNGLLFRGLHEGSYRSLGSEAAFELTEASLDVYSTPREKNTIRLHGYWGTSRGDVPFYKHHNQGRPAAFVGMAFDQLQGNRMTVLRADYIYSYTNLVQFKLMANVAVGLRQQRPNVTYSPKALWGLGSAVAITTPLGLLELTYGLGSRGFSDPNTLVSVVYLELGTRF